MNAGAALSAVAARGALALAPAIRLVRPDVGAGIDARRAAERDLLEWAAERPAGPLVWLHAASAGELLGAVPALERLASRVPHARLVTHFSPSGRMALERLRPDFACFPPLDLPERCREVLERLGPSLLVFSKHDLWPGLVAAAGAAGVPIALINAVVRPGSRRLRWPARSIFRATYARLDAVGAASEDDAARLRRLGVRDEALRVTGDGTFDLALARAAAARRPDGLATSFEGRLPRRPDVGRRLIAGSTWPRDERALLDALEALPATSGGRFGWQLVIVPHQPSEPRVRELVGQCRIRGHPVARWTDRPAVAELPNHGIVVFDEMGSLAELYAAGDVAYVGGGLGGSGLHNILEPAAAGVPVVFGPRYEREDAARLVEAGGALVCREQRLDQCITALAGEEGRRRVGGAARAYVERGGGAARATADMLDPFLDP